MALRSYEIPEILGDEIKELETLITAFNNGDILEAELKARRVPFGIYEQRKRGFYMVRVRCTAGIITPLQLKRVAELALQHASGLLHITTRQEIQIHDVALDDIIPIIKVLAEIGLSSRGGGGNTVRNITVPWNSGIDKNEVFDVTPYAIALTSALIARGDSWLLPRKYKIAFSSTEQDPSLASVQDLGFFANIKNGIPGFRVFVAGGMGRNSEPGHLLHDFIPASEILSIAEAIKRLFSKFGNRKNKHAARLRFLWNTLGPDRFIELYNKEKVAFLEEGNSQLFIQEYANYASVDPSVLPKIDFSPGFETWKSRYVIEQKQAELFAVRIPVLFGIVSADRILRFSEALIPYGENILRFTHDQNIGLRNIPSEYLGTIYELACTVSDLALQVPLFGNIVACAGASMCQLGICRSRDACAAVIDHLNSSSLTLEGLSDVRVHISGCSNSCGQHMIADIGFYGKAGRKEEHSYPLYNIVGGAVLNGLKTTQLAEKIDEISARDLPVFIEKLFENYILRKSEYLSFNEYLLSEGFTHIKQTANALRNIPSYEIDKSYYKDWGEADVFSLAGKGTGECSAGLFDLIEIDLARLRGLRAGLIAEKNDAIRIQVVYDLALVSARMLLITRGAEATTEAEIFSQFEALFIKQKLIPAQFANIVELGKMKNTGELLIREKEVIAFSEAVEALYLGMDNSLQFKSGAALPVEPNALHLAGEIKVDVTKDFRGVGCPMNFVKTKMALAQLEKGQILQILLDDGAPIQNVPKSVSEEGHSIRNQEKKDNYWVLEIQKQ